LHILTLLCKFWDFSLPLLKWSLRRSKMVFRIGWSVIFSVTKYWFSLYASFRSYLDCRILRR